MVNLIEEMKEYTDKELRLLGLGLWTSLGTDSPVFSVPNGQKLIDQASLATFSLLPLAEDPEQVGSVQLTPQQLYVRARLLQEFLKINGSKSKGDTENVPT